MRKKKIKHTTYCKKNNNDLKVWEIVFENFGSIVDQILLLFFEKRIKYYWSARAFENSQTLLEAPQALNLKWARSSMRNGINV